MLSRNRYSMLSLILVFMLLLGQTSVYAISYTDTSDHWASKEIQKWSDQGLLQGNEGKFNPEQNINRAEMAIILDRLMDYQKQGKNDYTDLGNNWYTEAILKNISAGTIVMDSNTVAPMEIISRQEAVAMFARALGMSKTDGNTSFLDDASISSEYKGYVKAFCDKGYINGMPDGTFAPTAPLTRATVVKIVDNILAAWLTKAGTYTEDYTGSVVINTKGVTLKGLTIGGNLIIAEGVAEGEVHLDGVTIKGNIIVRGGGENSIYLDDTNVNGDLKVNKENGKIRIVASGSTSIKVTKLSSGAILLENKLKGKGFESVVIPADTAKDSTMLFKGSFSEIDVDGDSATIEIDKTSKIDKLSVRKNSDIDISGEVKTLTLLDSAKKVTIDGSGEINDVKVKSKDAEIKVKKDIEINEVQVEAEDVDLECKGTIKDVTASKDAKDFKLSGSGSVKEVNIKADDAKIDTKGTKVKVSKGVDGVKVDGSSVRGGKTETSSGKPSTGDTSIIDKPSGGGGSGGSGGGGGGYTPPSNTTLVRNAKNSLSIAGDLSLVIDDLTLPTSKSGVSITWATTNENIISNTGSVTRPIYGLGNVNVTLTATLTKGSVSDTKEFTVTVLAEEAPDVGITYTIEEVKAETGEDGTIQKEVIEINGEVNTPETDITLTFEDTTLGETITLTYTTDEAETVEEVETNIPAEESTETESSDTPSEESTETESSDTPSEEATETEPSDAPAEEATETEPSDAPAEEATETESSDAPAEETTETESSDAPSEEATETESSDTPTEEATETESSDAPAEEATETESVDTEYSVSAEKVAQELVKYANDNITSDEWNITVDGSKIVFERKSTGVNNDISIDIDGDLSADRVDSECLEGSDSTGGTYQAYTINLEGEANTNIVAFASVSFGEGTAKTTINADGVKMIDKKTLDHLHNYLNDDPYFNSIDGWSFSMFNDKIFFKSKTAGVNVPVSFKIEYKMAPSQELVDALIPENTATQKMAPITILAVPADYTVYFDTDGVSNFDTAVKAESGLTSIDLSKFNEGDEIYAYMISNEPAISEFKYHIRSTNKIVIDDTNPTITNVDGDEITISMGTDFNPLTKVEVKDNFDTNVEIGFEYFSVLENKIVESLTKAGNYKVNYTATDSAHNSATSTVLLKITDEYVSVDSLDTIKVALDTAKTDINLPSEINVKLKNSDDMILDIASEWICDSYDGSTPGDYTFTTSGISLPDYIVTGSFDGTVSITVTVLDSTEIKVDYNRSIILDYNTGITKGDIQFPKEATIVLSNEEEVTVDLSGSTWTSNDFDGNTPGTYMFFTTMPEIPNVTNPDRVVVALTVNVEVLMHTVSFINDNPHVILKDVKIEDGKPLNISYLTSYNQFGGLCTDSQFNNVYTQTPITEDTTFYVEWIDRESVSEDILNYRDDRFADGYPRIEIDSDNNINAYFKLKSDSKAIVSALGAFTHYHDKQSVIDGAHRVNNVTYKSYNYREIIEDTDEHVITGIGSAKTWMLSNFVAFIIEQDNVVSENPTVVQKNRILYDDKYLEELSIEEIHVNKSTNEILFYTTEEIVTDPNDLDTNDFTLANRNITSLGTMNHYGFYGFFLEFDNLDNFDAEELKSLEYSGNKLVDEYGNQVNIASIKDNFEDKYKGDIDSIKIVGVKISNDNTRLAIEFDKEVNVRSELDVEASMGNVLDPTHLELERFYPNYRGDQDFSRYAYFTIKNSEDMFDGPLLLGINNVGMPNFRNLNAVINVYRKSKPMFIKDAIYNVTNNILSIRIANSDIKSVATSNNFILSIGDKEYRLYNSFLRYNDDGLDDDGNQIDVLLHTNDNIRFSITTDTENIKIKYAPVHEADRLIFDETGAPLFDSEGIEVKVVTE